MKGILVFGSIPPPIGGVTRFVKNLLEAIRVDDKNQLVGLVSFLNVLSPKYDIWHINYSHPVKILIFISLGRLLGKKVFFVKHGGKLSLKSKAVLLSIKLSHGVFCLNENVYNQLRVFDKNSLIHTTIFKENLSSFQSGTRLRTNSKLRLLLYINNSGELEGREIYGAKFVHDCLSCLLENYELVVVDISKDYKAMFSGINGVEYINKHVDFQRTLNSVDVYIRPTSTDGNSVAVLEAGILGVKVLASDVVQRPDFVNTYVYGSKESFLKGLEKISKEDTKKINIPLSSVREVLSFIRKVK